MCLACSTGFSSPTGSTKCSVCPPGTSLVQAPGKPCVPCAMGYFSTQNSSATCSPCSIGYSTGVPGLSTCSTCNPGFFNNQSGGICTACPINSYNTVQGSTTCSLCPIGTSTSGVTGLTSCIGCAPGLFGVSAGGDCKPCPTGYFSAQNSSKACSPCPIGTSTSITGMSSCDNCSIGYFNDESGAQCAMCPVNYFADKSGSTQCSKCPAGFSTNNQKNATVCLGCSVGFFNSNPASSCLPCEKDSFSNMSGLTACFPCINSIAEALGSISEKQCILCTEGAYGTPPQTPCKICPNGLGLSCPQGSHLPFITYGFFRDPNNPEVALRCSPSSSCLGSQDNRITPCSPGYQGFLCGECAAHYYRIDQECRACPSAVMGALTVLGAVSLLLIAIIRTMKSNVKFSSDTRIVLQSLQIIALYPQITIKWPKPIISFFQMLSIAVTISFPCPSDIFLYRTLRLNFSLLNAVFP
jgi:hypothetical protein